MNIKSWWLKTNANVKVGLDTKQLENCITSCLKMIYGSLTLCSWIKEGDFYWYDGIQSGNAVYTIEITRIDFQS